MLTKLLQNIFDHQPQLDKLTYSVGETSRLTHYSADKIYKLIQQGQLKALQFGKKGRYRIGKAELAKLLA